MPFFYYDATYLLLIPGILLALFAQLYVNSAYKKYQSVPTLSGFTGADAARRILDENGLSAVTIEKVSGQLTDHYDPRHNVLRLSPAVYGTGSISALALAAHEVGHAVQKNTGYAFLSIRNAILPVVQVCSYAAIPLLILGIALEAFYLTDIAIILYASVILFHLITLPVEFNASRRAIALLERGGYLQYGEITGAKKVLRAAALTYVASALMAILQLLRLVLLSGGRRRD
ncbi:zinc metallopeptidase [Eubacteriales bacterium OttesenSCG-928-M02]|nr:zinc metallopeptidase [Eubacteriales bacterium OttesenSCG-928-M02]